MQHTLQTRINFAFSMKLKFYLKTALGPGQTDSQVVASSNKLSLRRNLRWVDKRTREFSPEYTVAKKNHFKADISCISLANSNRRHSTCADLGWVAKR